MKGKFGRRCRENQPATTGIDRREAEYVPEESAIGIRILRVYDCMHSGDRHGYSCL
jgi:hypothetical protein